jgi:hypothetical protein
MSSGKIRVRRRVFEAAEDLRAREEELARTLPRRFPGWSAALTEASMQRAGAKEGGDKEGIAFWGNVCRCLRVTADEIIVLKDKPETLFPFRKNLPG